jgi:hypothetical protein
MRTLCNILVYQGSTFRTGTGFGDPVVIVVRLRILLVT